MCKSFNASLEASGFVCLGHNSSEYLRCHLAEKVAYMMPCAAGTSCRAPVNRYTAYNPCVWSYPYPLDGYTSMYNDGYPPRNGADELCKIFTVNGTFCAAMFGLDTDSTTVVHCVDGKVDSISACTNGTTCANTVFVEDDNTTVVEDHAAAICVDLPDCTTDDILTGRPCKPVTSPVDDTTCGNGVLDEDEECERDYFGCDDNCRCKEGYHVAQPATWYCIKSPAEELPTRIR